VDPQLKHLMNELGEAINDSLSESDQIAEVIARIKAGGYDVFLILEATLGFNKPEPEEETAASRVVGGSGTGDGSDPGFRVNPGDVKFLKSLRISLED
jgi:hypothetical protein